METGILLLIGMALFPVIVRVFVFALERIDKRSNHVSEPDVHVHTARSS